eukprot:6411627-Amphidinium_carterae.1
MHRSTAKNQVSLLSNWSRLCTEHPNSDTESPRPASLLHVAQGPQLGALDNNLENDLCGCCLLDPRLKSACPHRVTK